MRKKKVEDVEEDDQEDIEEDDQEDAEEEKGFFESMKDSFLDSHHPYLILHSIYVLIAVIILLFFYYSTPEFNRNVIWYLKLGSIFLILGLLLTIFMTFKLFRSLKITYKNFSVVVQISIAVLILLLLIFALLNHEKVANAINDKFSKVNTGYFNPVAVDQINAAVNPSDSGSG